jgi:hypothetical protein
MTDIPVDRPDAAELIAVARETFRQEILPFMKDEQRLTALMILNALAIAERELRNPAPGILDAEPLIHAIRAGRHDDDRELCAALLADARARAAIADPRHLQRREI